MKKDFVASGSHDGTDTCMKRKHATIVKQISPPSAMSNLRSFAEGWFLGRPKVKKFSLFNIRLTPFNAGKIKDVEGGISWKWYP